MSSGEIALALVLAMLLLATGAAAGAWAGFKVGYYARDEELHNERKK